jgi:hypothetical protein
MDKSPGQRSSASSKFGELDRITQSLDIFSDPTDIFSLVLQLYPEFEGVHSDSLDPKSNNSLYTVSVSVFGAVGMVNLYEFMLFHQHIW